jgi:hypothetical protein
MASEVIIEKLVFKMFKGVYETEIELKNRTVISGRNKSGKSTFLNGWSWLLSGKDQFDRQDYEIKPNKFGVNLYDRPQCSVEAFILVDGVQRTIKRTYTEVWTKKRGDEVEVMTGHTTKYWIDLVPIGTEKEFKARIEEIIPDNVFKLLSSTTYFNSLKPDNRREILLSLVAKPLQSAVIEMMEADTVTGIKELTEMLNQGRTTKEVAAIVNAQRTELNKQIKEIAPRIDECNKSLVVYGSVMAIEEKKVSLTAQLSEVQSQINDSVKALSVANDDNNKEIIRLNGEAFKVELSKTNFVQSEEKKARDSFNTELANYNAKEKRKTAFENKEGIFEITETLKSVQLANKLAQLREEQSAKGAEYLELANSEFEMNEDATICPTCKRVHDEDKLYNIEEEMRGNFNADKAKKLKAMIEDAATLKAQISKVKAEITENDNLVLKSKSDYKEVCNWLLTNQKPVFVLATADTTDFDNQISVLKVQIEELQSKVLTVDNSALEAKKQALETELKTVESQLLQIAVNKKTLDRIEQLKALSKKLNSELAGFEKIGFAMGKYNEYFVRSIEKDINAKFDKVSFSMFKTNITTGEVVPCCQTLVEGVDYYSANNAGQINAGLEIIKVLSNHYGIKLPVFVDNAEGVNDLIEMNTQLIELVVTTEPLAITYK